MHEYEIRILSAGHTVAVIDEVQRSDSVAIRSAKKFAGARPFEVWRGSDCVYGISGAARARKTRNSPSL